jgi:LPXTG-motif cell wall-anchored protein
MAGDTTVAGATATVTAKKSDSSNAGPIVGGVIGVIVVIGAAALYFRKKR